MFIRSKPVTRINIVAFLLVSLACFTPAQHIRAGAPRIAHIPGYTVQETIGVPINGQAVVSSTVLESNVIYKLRASGTAIVGGPGFFGDAEYSFNASLSQVVDQCTSPTLDFGIAVNDTAVTATKQPRWGDFRSDHVYSIDFTGNGSTITVNYHDCKYNDNSGYLVVDILRPTNDSVLESVQVPSNGSAATSISSLEVGSLYQLRAYGLLGVDDDFGLGDAEYGPKHALEDKCSAPFPVTDIGIGVNDTVIDSQKSPFWGAFSQSHVYSTLIVGTGAPISFNFHDCKYDDNSGSLAVEIIKINNHPLYLPFIAR